MYFLSPNLPSSTFTSVAFTFSSALPPAVKVKRMAVKFGATSTQLMRNLRATFANMRRFAGVKSLLLPLMPQRMFMLHEKHWEDSRTPQLQQHFSELRKVKLLTVIGSTQHLRLGTLFFSLINWIILDAIDSAEIVRWVAESKRPFQIVNDRAFKSLMKTGRPGYRIPSAETVSKDVKQVFVRVRHRIAKMLQV